MEEKRRRGRPRLNLTDEEMSLRRKKQRNESVKKYKKNHPDIISDYEKSFYKIVLRLPKKSKTDLKKLSEEQGKSYTDLFVDLVFEKFGIDLRK